MMLVKDDDRRLVMAAAKKAGTAPPIPFGRVMASPVTWGAVIATFCYMYFVYFCMTRMPAYFVEQRGLSLSKMGLYTFFSFGGEVLFIRQRCATCDSEELHIDGFHRRNLHEQ